MSTVSLARLADLLTDQLEQRHPDPSPVRDRSETAIVDLLYRVGGAEAHLADRMTAVLARLRAPGAHSGTVMDGQTVLGSYRHLLDLQRQVTA